MDRLEHQEHCVLAYDDANRVTTEVNAAGTVTFSYDSAGELLSASGSRTESYSYDSGGNRTMTGYTTSTGNELTASPGYTYTYDNEGDLLSQTNTSTHVVTTYTYDNRNRLKEATVGGTVVASYVYDALNRRIGFDDNSTQTWTVYDGVNPYADFNGSGTLLSRYVSGPAIDEIFARTSSGGTSAWYLADRLGSVRDIVNTSGTALDHVVYDSYGNIVTETSASNGDRFKYAGMEYDSVTGQYYDRARFYNAAIGRFMSQDPLGFRAGDFNVYRYALNSTPNLMDPTGMAVPKQYMNQLEYAHILELLEAIRKAMQEALAKGTAQALEIEAVERARLVSAMENFLQLYKQKMILMMRDEQTGIALGASNRARDQFHYELRVTKWFQAMLLMNEQWHTILHEFWHMQLRVAEKAQRKEEEDECDTIADLVMKALINTQAYRESVQHATNHNSTHTTGG